MCQGIKTDSMISLQLKAKHFKGTKFFDQVCGCAIEKAAMEVFDTTRKKVGENQTFLLLSKNNCIISFNHVGYYSSDFKTDKATASSHNYDETVIRTIKLIEQ